MTQICWGMGRRWLDEKRRPEDGQCVFRTPVLLQRFAGSAFAIVPTPRMERQEGFRLDVAFRAVILPS
jgi:hypothetical protein